MTFLDTRTTLGIASLLFAVLPLLVVWGTYGQQRQTVAWWCAGSALASVGILLVLLRPWLPAIVSFHIANTCFLASLLLWSQALRCLLLRPWSAKFVGFCIAVAAGYYSIAFSVAGPDLRAAAPRLALGALALYTAFTAQQIARHLRSHNGTAMAAGYTALGLTLLLQAIIIVVTQSPTGLIGETWDAGMLALVILITTVIGHFGLTGLVLDLSIQTQLQNASARTGALETARIDTLLRARDRGDRMELVTRSLAHELNQPLTAALTHAYIVQRRLSSGLADVRTLTDQAGKVAMTLQRANAILNRMRNAPPIQAPRLITFDLRDTVAEAIELGRMETPYQVTVIDFLPGEDRLLILGDELAISQVLANLLRNAMDALDGGIAHRIEIQCSIADHCAQVSVRDHGSGIAPDVLCRLGAPFTSNRPRGLGLGLTIAKAIVAQHRGVLTLANHADGGAVAVLSLPLQTDAQDA